MLQIVLQPTATDVPAVSGDAPISAIGMVAIVVILALVVTMLIIGAIRRLQRPEIEGMSPDKVRHHWEQIRASAKQGKLGEKIAIIEADKLLDNVLKSMLMPGDTMAERLKMAAYKYPHIKDIWEAHKLRNRLVHETSFELKGEAHWALNDYEDALRLLRVLS